MSKILNDQMLDTTNLDSPKESDRILLTKEKAEEKESAIEYGNLKDYIEIFGESDDI